MTREIKFRAWNKNNDEMVYSFDYPYHWNIGDLGLELLESDGTDYVRQEAVFMQYTGLKDKSGVEIYEGDINENDSEDAHEVIIFDEGSFWLEGSTYTFPLHESKTETDITIIGNIHEHPHLLGGVDK